MVEAGAKQVTEAQVVGALDAGAHRDQADRRRHRRAEGRGRQEEADGDAAGRSRRVPREDRGSRRSGRSPTRCASRRSSTATRTVDKVHADLIASLGESPEAQQKKDADHIFHELKEKVMRDEVLETRRPPRRPQVRRDPPDLDRDRRAAARPRLGRLHARRDAGAGHLHARHRRRRAEGRARHRRVLQALHAALQLPAVLGRRDRPLHRARAAARSATARWPSGRWRRSSRPRRSSPTRSASSPTSSSRTARRRWRRSAAARWR